MRYLASHREMVVSSEHVAKVRVSRNLNREKRARVYCIYFTQAHLSWLT